MSLNLDVQREQAKTDGRKPLLPTTDKSGGLREPETLEPWPQKGPRAMQVRREADLGVT